MGTGPFVTGLTDGEGGIARPRRGVRVPLLVLLPGMGGRRSGAGEDILRGLLSSGIFRERVSSLPHLFGEDVVLEGVDVLVVGYMMDRDDL